MPPFSAVPKALSERPLYIFIYSIVEDVGIALCCSDVAVSENLLYGSDGHAPVDEDGGAGHSRAVERQVLPDVHPLGQPLQQLVASAVGWQSGEQPSPRCDEGESLS